jgi:hypothetical protein
VTRDAAGGRKLDKAKSQGRIDGLVSLAMAVSVALVKLARVKFDPEALIA